MYYGAILDNQDENSSTLAFDYHPVSCITPSQMIITNI